MKEEYTKTIVLTDRPVTGTYKFRDKFQIYPSLENAPRCPYFKGQHPCILEFKYKNENIPKSIPPELFGLTDSKINYPIPKEHVEGAAERKTFIEILLLLTLFSKHHFSNVKAKMVWVLPFKNDHFQKVPIWGQEGYRIPEFNCNIKKFLSIGSVKKISKVAITEYYRERTPMFLDEFTLPENIDILFSAYYSLKNKAQETFLKSALLFQCGLDIRNISDSISYASMISALETLIDFENNQKPKRCKECGQKMYQVGEKFRKFISEYFHFKDENGGKREKDEREKKKEEIANKMYNQRSNILHNGHLFLSDIDLIKSIFSFAGAKEGITQLNTIDITWNCINNWLIHRSKQ